MKNEDGDKPKGWDEYIKLHKEKLAAMENKEVIKGCVGRERFWEDEDIFDLSDEQLNAAYVREEDLEEAKLKAKLRLELATYEDGMVSMEDYITQIITVCNIHFIVNSSVGGQDDE